MNKQSASGLTTRTPRVIGREAELERLHNCLQARGEKHYLYYWAHGGLGKTRLLEELQAMVEEAGPGFYSTGIIDLYHTDTHSTSDLERAIVEGLDPARKYFTLYRQERERYELLRERGTDPGILERRRAELGRIFVKDCREMSVEARKLVILLDTVELLQYESSLVEEMAGLETVDARIKPWLLQNLAQLANVLVVFAGRPKLPAPDEQTDPQARLVADMRAAFDQALEVIELQPFTLEETRTFVEALSDGVEVIPAEQLPIVHRLTGGRPIFLHLVVDLLRVLSPQPRAVLEMFAQHAALVDAPEDDARLKEARDRMEREILRGIVNEETELGGFLSRLALMPKGVDAEILHQALGLPQEEAERLLVRLEPLSFAKRHEALRGAERLHGERIFFHDEMYRLLMRPDVMPNLRLNERMVAHALEMNYYNPHIAQLERELEDLSPAERIPHRERLQKLQVERLYYLLARDPREGYAEYKRLSDQANRRRWVGYSMRLLDEFLRFYNTPDRRKQFEAAGISHEQVIRESAQMWVERFHWWGQYEREIPFARAVLDKPDAFCIRPVEDAAVLGNVCALWARARAMLHGYEPEVVAEAQAMLERLPPLADCTPEQALARARLATSIGYQYRRGGLLARAGSHYVESVAAFRTLEGYRDELTMVLNNLAVVYAEQGRIALARPLVHESLRVNEEMENEYSTGLTLSIHSEIARMRGNYPQAINYGEEALDIFRELEDAHGRIWAYYRIGYAKRRMAKHELEKGRSKKLEKAHQMLEEAAQSVEQALEVARAANIEADVPMLLAEKGRVYRELGSLVSRLKGAEQAQVYYYQSEQFLTEALSKKAGLTVVDRANMLQDLADTLFLAGRTEGARKYLAQIEELIGPDYRFIPGEQVPSQDLPAGPFAPLGKVEMTRGQMAFAQGEMEEGIRHYVLAYAYFMRFSSDALEIDSLTEYLYGRLHNLPVARQRELMASLREWIKQQDLGMDVTPFVETVESLIGV